MVISAILSVASVVLPIVRDQVLARVLLTSDTVRELSGALRVKPSCAVMKLMEWNGFLPLCLKRSELPQILQVTGASQTAESESRDGISRPRCEITLLPCVALDETSDGIAEDTIPET